MRQKLEKMLRRMNDSNSLVFENFRKIFRFVVNRWGRIVLSAFWYVFLLLYLPKRITSVETWAIFCCSRNNFQQKCMLNISSVYVLTKYLVVCTNTPNKNLMQLRLENPTRSSGYQKYDENQGSICHARMGENWVIWISLKLRLCSICLKQQ